MIQNTPIDMQSVAGFTAQSLESESVKTVNRSSLPESENDSASYLPFAVELEKAAAKSQAAQTPIAVDIAEVVVVASPDPEFSFEVSEETGFTPPEINVVDDQPKIRPAPTPTTQSQPNQAVLVFLDHSQRVALDTKSEAEFKTLNSNLVEMNSNQEAESPVVHRTTESDELLTSYLIDKDALMVGPSDELRVDTTRISAEPGIAVPVRANQRMANTAYATPALAAATRVEQRGFIQPIVTQLESSQPIDTQIKASQPIDTQIKASQPIDTQINNPEPARATQLVDAPTIDLQTSLEAANPTPIVDAQTIDPPTRQIVASPIINTPASADSSVTNAAPSAANTGPSAELADRSASTHIEASRAIPVDSPTPQRPTPIVAATPLPAPSANPTTQVPVDLEINQASLSPVELEIEQAIRVPVDPKATTDVAHETVETRKPFLDAVSPVGRERLAVETVTNEERVIETADSQSSQIVELPDAESTPNEDSFSQSGDETTDLAMKPVKVSPSADHELQFPVESEFEWVGSDPNLRADRPKPTQPAQVSHHEIFVQVPSSRLVNETLARPSSFDPPIAETGRIVSEHVSETLIREIQVDGKSDSKQLRLHLHPEELGKLTVHVGWESESIVAKIVASELATSEMLNRDRGWLMDSLQANGLELDSFEVSYEGSTNRHAFRQDGETAAPTGERGPDPANTNTNTRPAIDGKGSVVNLIA